MAKRNITPYTPHYNPKWIAVEEWDGFEKGEKVLVKGERGVFTFQSAHLVEDECVAVNVVGGPIGHFCFRAFTPNRVSKPKVKRQRKPKFD